MNIVSALVGITIMGAAAPSMLQMSLAPVEAQKRADNFTVAESAAVTFAAANEGQKNVSNKIPDNCELTNVGPSAFDITCTGGQGRYLQTVTRSFRLDAGSTYTNPTRSFAWDTPADFSHVPCLPGDPWGVMWYNEHLKAGGMKACIPAPLRTKQTYLDSNPDDWLFDISNYGWGQHPDF